MKYRSVCILGGSGFVGRHLTARLATQGIRCRILTRHPQRHRSLRVPFNVELRQANVLNDAELAAGMAGCDAVINLIGILNESKRVSFRRMHVEFVDQVLDACRKTGIGRLLHMSALHADAAHGVSRYLRSKGEGAGNALTKCKPGIAVTAFEPSVIFGPDDSFINRFAQLLRIPGPLPLACPEARFAPVYVGDVAEAFCRALNNPASIGQRYPLCGPQQYSLIEIVRYVSDALQLYKPVIGLSDSLSALQARLLQHLPGKPFTPDNYRSLQQPSVCDGRNGLIELGISPTHMDSIVPALLRHERPRDRYMSLRRVSGK